MYARIENNVIVEILKPLNGFKIEDCFHPEILKNTVQVPENAQLGDLYGVEVVEDIDNSAEASDVVVDESVVSEPSVDTEA